MTDIYKSRKGIKNLNDETKNFFGKTENWNPVFLSRLSEINDQGFNNFITQQNLADKSLIAFLRDANYGTKNLKTYQKYLHDTGNAIYTFSNLTAKAGTLLKSFGAAMASIGISWMIGRAINLAITLFDKIYPTLDKQREITDKLQSELSDIRSDLTEINSQLQTTADRINELNAKDSLSFIEKEELATLIAENDELERRAILLAAQEAKKQSETAASVKKEFEKEYGDQIYERITTQPEAESMHIKRERYYELYNNDQKTDVEIREQNILHQELDAWDQPFSSFTEHIQELISAYEYLNQKKREGAELTEYEETLLSKYQTELADTALNLSDYSDKYEIDDETNRSWDALSQAPVPVSGSIPY